jgi:hypothetical protein
MAVAKSACRRFLVYAGCPDAAFTFERLSSRLAPFASAGHQLGHHGFTLHPSDAPHSVAKVDSAKSSVIRHVSASAADRGRYELLSELISLAGQPVSGGSDLRLRCLFYDRQLTAIVQRECM